MKNILHVDSSILGGQSASRRLTAAIVEQLLAIDPGAQVTYRDVVADPLPQFTGAVAMARGQQPDARDPLVARSVTVLDAVLGEVLAADTIVVGAPMYNFAIPSQLKAWIDALAVAGTTFRYTDRGPEGLLGGRRLLIASSRGGLYGAGTPQSAMDHQEAYLRNFFAFLGIDAEVIRAEGLMMGDAVRERALAAALNEAALLRAAA